MDAGDAWGLFLILVVAVVVFVVISIVISTVVGIFYCLTLQKALSRCSPQSRTLPPGLVWLYLIPLFNLMWHFFIVINVARSLHAEFVYRGIVEEPNPGQGIGLATCILNITAPWIPYAMYTLGVDTWILYVGWVTGIAGFVCWIVYWVKIAGFSGKISQPYMPPQPPAGAASPI